MKNESKMNEKEECSVCRFYNELDRLDPEEGTLGACRRYPPNRTEPGDTTENYPRVFCFDWCGEFQRITK